MENFDFYVCGNAIVDYVVHITDDELKKLGYEKGSYASIDKSAYLKLLNYFAVRDKIIMSGGAITNSAIVTAGLGSKTAYLGAVGKDLYGELFNSELTDLGISTNIIRTTEPTGICFSMVTPDSERTMRTNLGAAGTLATKDLNDEYIRNSNMVLIEGYLLLLDSTRSLLLSVIEKAKEHNKQVIFTTASKYVVDNYANDIIKIVSQSDIVFAAEDEALSFGKTSNFDEALKKLSSSCNHCVVTKGEKGAVVVKDKKVTSVPAFPSKPIDLTGAGDTFCGAYLHVFNKTGSVKLAACQANYFAARIIEQDGARYQGDLRKLYKDSEKACPQ